MDWLFSLFLGTTLFGLGISIIDFIGLLDQGNDDGEAEDGEAGSDDSLEAGDHGSQVAFHQKSSRNVLISFLQVLRALVYFSLGFGPIGLIGLWLDSPSVQVLVVSLAMGIITVFLAFLVKKLVMKTTDSQMKDEDLIMEVGDVVISIAPGQIGRIRLKVNGRYEERYAKLSSGEKMVSPGSQVRVVNFDDDLLVVEEEKVSRKM